MTLPTLAGIPLLDAEIDPLSGAAFNLDRESRADGLVRQDDLTIEIRRKARLVVVRGGRDRSCGAAVTSALQGVQQGLDLLSMDGVDDLAVTGVDDDHVAWWPTPDGLVVRVVSITPFGFSVQARGMVTDPSGQVVQSSPKVPAAWHQSFRYFRLSQASDDLFDAYRNAFLALESVLSSLAPQRFTPSGRAAEGEGGWFRRALEAADGILPLSAFVPVGTVDPIDWLYRDLYEGTRSAMSHAKSGRAVLIPHDAANRDAVVVSLERLVRIYLGLIEAHLGVRRPAGGLSEYAFREMSMAVLANMTACATDDESPFDSADTAINPGGGGIVELPDIQPPDASAPFLTTRLSSAPTTDLMGLPFIRRVAAMAPDGRALMVTVLEGRLSLGAAVRLEVMFGARGRNVQQPRTRYPL